MSAPTLGGPTAAGRAAGAPPSGAGPDREDAAEATLGLPAMGVRPPVANQGELSDLDPFDLMDIESTRLDIFLCSLPGDAWSRGTRCAGWDVTQLLAHLATVEEYSLACLDDSVDELLARARDEGAEDMDAFNEWGVRARRGVPPQQLRERWRADNAEVRRRMRWRGRSGTISTSGGWYPAGLQGFYLAVEYATHADDIGAPVGVDERPGRTHWRARFTRFALAESGSPITLLVGSRGNSVRYHGEEAVLTDEDLVDAGTGRLSASDDLPQALCRELVCLA